MATTNNTSDVLLNSLNVCDPITIKLTNIYNADIAVSSIYNFFEESKIGNVDSIDIMYDEKKKYYKVIFSKWNPLRDGARIRQKLQQGFKESFFIDGKLFQGEYPNFIRQKPKQIKFKCPY